MRNLARALGLRDLSKLRFKGTLSPRGTQDWLLAGSLGATVVQNCVVTLDPVRTRIDTPVRRLFVADWQEPAGEEIEMPEDDEAEPLGDTIDLAAIMAEALALAMPLYPRKGDAELGQSVHTEPGRRALTDEAAKPFAGLAALRDSLKKDQ